VTHPGRQAPQAGTAGGGERVSGVPQVVAVESGQTNSGNGLPPGGGPPGVAPPWLTAPAGVKTSRFLGFASKMNTVSTTTNC